MEVKDYYRVLQVPRSATHKEIHEAYHRRREAIMSADTSVESMDLLGEVGKAFMILGDSQKREAYDQQYDQVLARSTQAKTQNDTVESGQMNTAHNAAQPDVDRMENWLREVDGNTVRQFQKQRSTPQKKSRLSPTELGWENILALLFAVLIVIGLASYSLYQLYLILSGKAEGTFWNWALAIGGSLISIFAVLGWASKNTEKEE